LLLFEAFSRASHVLPSEVRLVVVGDGPERGALQQFISDHNLGDRIVLSGHQGSLEALDAIYRSSFLAASPGYVGLSVIQALGHGVPVLVARDEPHSPEIEACEEPSNTRFFKSDDPDDAAKGMLEVWERRSHWNSLGPSIAAKIAAKYTYEAMTAALADAFTWRPNNGFASVRP
jgi:glycosyltransferase involved in cell wall biosynthesis